MENEMKLKDKFSLVMAVVGAFEPRPAESTALWGKIVSSSLGLEGVTLTPEKGALGLPVYPVPTCWAWPQESLGTGRLAGCPSLPHLKPAPGVLESVGQGVFWLLGSVEASSWYLA